MTYYFPLKGNGLRPRYGTGMVPAAPEYPGATWGSPYVQASGTAVSRPFTFRKYNFTCN